ncbi:MAG: Fe(3+) ABC transporter substrate-binding protein [Gammaproteobacteria bacterium]
MRRFWLLAVLIMTVGPVAAAEVNIYSARKEALIKPLLDIYSDETGVKINLVTGKADALIKRLQLEGNNSPADLLLTVDVGRLHRAKQAGLLQPVKSEVLLATVPANYRDRDGYWFGLSLRSRIIVYARDRVSPTQLSTYEALADPKWHGQLCIRSSSNIYNQSLVASLVAHQGVAATEEWAKGLVANFARSPKGGDRDQIKAVAAGQCNLALVNTYYLAGMLHSKIDAEVKAASKVALFWPNQRDRGAHVNISGAGVTRSAKHRDAAIRLLEFLVSDAAQQWYAKTNYEYPIRSGVNISETLRQWGEFKADPVDLTVLGEYNSEALRLMDRAGWK